LVVLHREQVVTIFFYDCFRDISLAPHRNNRNGGSAQVDSAQKLWNRGHFDLCIGRPLLSSDKDFLGQARADGVNRSTSSFYVKATPTGLAVNGETAQVALAWVLSRDVPIAAIPGTRRIERLEENWASQDIVLRTDQLNRLESLANQGVVGARY